VENAGLVRHLSGPAYMNIPGFGVLRLVGAFFLLAVYVMFSFRLCVDVKVDESGDKSPHSKGLHIVALGRMIHQYRKATYQLL
jgi:hypothetical protein